MMRLYAQIARRTPLMSGLTVLAFNRVTNRAFGAATCMACARTQSGLRVEVDANDHDGRILYLFGTNDPKVQALASALLSPGDTFLDIGANYSTIGLFASRIVGPHGHVHLFEPQQTIAERVQAAMTAGGVSNASLHRVALMDKDATMTMKIPPSHSGMATLVESSHQSDWTALSIPVRGIADYVGPLVSEKPFGAKLDVEGAEPHLIPWLVRQPNLKFLIFEAAQNQDTLFDLVRRAGLTVFGLRRTIFRKQVEHVRSASDLAQFHDVVALRIGVEPPALVSMRGLRRLFEKH
jgi:FkbM family methyltransferase